MVGQDLVDDRIPGEAADQLSIAPAQNQHFVRLIQLERFAAMSAVGGHPQPSICVCRTHTSVRSIAQTLILSNESDVLALGPNGLTSVDVGAE